MTTIYNIYRVNKNDPKYQEYFILFGNRSEGWNCSKEELKEFWRKAVKASASNYYGDVTLMYKSKLIRAVNNFNIKLLDKSTKFRCTYNKYRL